eukprot:6077221-Prymnesium_polylepis.1
MRARTGGVRGAERASASGLLGKRRPFEFRDGHTPSRPRRTRWTRCRQPGPTAATRCRPEEAASHCWRPGRPSATFPFGIGKRTKERCTHSRSHAEGETESDCTPHKSQLTRSQDTTRTTAQVRVSVWCPCRLPMPCTGASTRRHPGVPARPQAARRGAIGHLPHPPTATRGPRTLGLGRARAGQGSLPAGACVLACVVTVLARRGRLQAPGPAPQVRGCTGHSALSTHSGDSGLKPYPVSSTHHSSGPPERGGGRAGARGSLGGCGHETARSCAFGMGWV